MIDTEVWAKIRVPLADGSGSFFCTLFVMMLATSSGSPITNDIKITSLSGFQGCYSIKHPLIKLSLFRVNPMKVHGVTDSDSVSSMLLFFAYRDRKDSGALPEGQIGPEIAECLNHLIFLLVVIFLQISCQVIMYL